mmetsp:Transcript_17278/g.47853  ORF Transcript_17278/g.47853 Transcript_17278/m.47853 type:complete len:202 (-) Transcript_17278:251-856(-)
MFLSASKSIDQHLLLDLVSCLLAEQLFSELQRKFQRRARTLRCRQLAGDDNFIVRWLGEQFAELRRRVARRTLLQETLGRQRHSRRCADRGVQLIILLLLLQDCAQCVGITQVLGAWHTTWQCDEIPLLLGGIFHRHIRDHLDASAHRANELAIHDGGSLHLRAESRESVGNACSLNLLAAITDGNQNALRHGQIARSASE